MLRGLSPYRVLRALARGGQGDVLLALDTRSGRRVCIKLYHYEGGERERRRLQEEAFRLATIDCPQVVQLHDVVAHGGRLALVTRYVPGCDLERLLQANPDLATEEAVAIASDIAAALASLRRARFVHGDLSPRNILISGEGRAVVADLGAALRAGVRSMACADLAQSPEQARGATIDLRSDFFALGLLLHRMLTGEHPFASAGRLDRDRLLRGLQAAPPLPRVPADARPALQGLLLDLLAAAPDRRPSGTFELRERLRDLRARLPAVQQLGTRALAVGRPAPPPNVSLRLPPRLLRLPLWRQLAAALRSYWDGGTAGARALLVAALAMPAVLTVLLLLQPGPCIAVRSPVYGPGASELRALPPPVRTEALLTSLLKTRLGGAVVLGRGPDSDSRWQLTAAGPRNVCVAQRSVELQVGCTSGLCTVDLRGRRPGAMVRHRLEVPGRASRRELLAGLDQLIAEQARFLLP